MNELSCAECCGETYAIRRLTPADAPGVTRLVQAVYGDTYYPPDLYDPGQIIRLNAAERLVSVVALDGAGQVVGHFALERPHPTNVAESSDALVLPAHRHHHLMERMRLVLRQEAIRLGLAGLVGYAVTNHVFSQKMEEHVGAHPCGIALGLWPESFHNMPEPLTQRMSFAIYFRYLHLPAYVVHAATPHAPVLTRICQQYGIAVRESAGPPEGPGEVALSHEPEVQAGTIRVPRVGTDTAAAVRAGRVKLCEGFGAKAVTLELPLAQPGTAEVCRAAEDEGFFFCGLGPAFADDGDMLLLQYLAEDNALDCGGVEIVNPFAQELLTYVAGERERVRGDRCPRADCKCV
jgi:hypothetical protein